MKPLETFEQFELIRSEDDHERNEMHVLCRLYRYWRNNGVKEEDARRYIKWHFKYRTYRRDIEWQELKTD